MIHTNPRSDAAQSFITYHLSPITYHLIPITFHQFVFPLFPSKSIILAKEFFCLEIYS